MTIAHAANYTSIGSLDVQKVFKEYKETSKAQGELAKQEETFKKEFEESQKKLETAGDVNGDYLGRSVGGGK